MATNSARKNPHAAIDSGTPGTPPPAVNDHVDAVKTSKPDAGAPASTPPSGAEIIQGPINDISGTGATSSTPTPKRNMSQSAFADEETQIAEAIRSGRDTLLKIGQCLKAIQV